jgi:NAD(P)-dependent dehydrogenase (short-subunit alcohol dehydrogenase family)
MLAASGLFRVIATMRSTSLSSGEPRLRELIQRYRTEGNSSSTKDLDMNDILKVCALDVTSETSWLALCTHLPDRGQRIDALINNAGYGVSGSIEQVTVEQAQRLFDANVFGVMRGVQALAPRLRAQARRNKANGMYTAMIQISSLAGLRAVPFTDLYSASKFALEGITEAMRYSMEPFGVRCICVNPGPVRSSFTARFGVASRDRGSRSPHDDDQAVVRTLNAMHTHFVRDLNKRMASSTSGQSSSQVAVTIVRAVVDGLCLPEAPSLHYGTSPVVEETIHALRTDPAARTALPYRRFWEEVATAQKEASSTAES